MIWLVITSAILAPSVMVLGWNARTHDSCMDDFEAAEEEMKFNCAHVLQSEKPDSTLWRETLQMTLELIKGDESLGPDMKESLLNAHRSLVRHPSNQLPTEIKSYLQRNQMESEASVKVRRTK